MILETIISSFKSTKQTSVDKNVKIGEVLSWFKDGKFKSQIEKVRLGDSEVKKFIPTFAMHGIFDGFREKNKFIEASGLIILDLDDVDVDEIEDTKEDIMESSDNVLAVMTSPSGNGIKILYLVEESLVTPNNYKEIGKLVVDEFDIYGHVDVLSTTDCLIATYDPKLLINENATPAFVYIKERVVEEHELEERDLDKPLWENVEDFFETVLVDNLHSTANNNFHFIQISILDLAKFGFYHPKEDLSFVLDYASEFFGHSKKNKKRFDEVVEVAKDYPQKEWAYRLIESNGEDLGMPDLSDYMDEDDGFNFDDDEDVSDELKLDSIDGMVDYSTFFEKVLEVAAEGDRVGYETSLKSFSNIFRWKGTGILTITGIPSHGKSEFVDACLIDLARLHGHSSLVVGFEQRPEEHVIKIIRKMVGKNITCSSYFKDNQEEIKDNFNFVTAHIKHVNTTKVGGDINAILETAAAQIQASRKEGKDMKYLVIDPFNMLSIKGRYSGHEKIEEILRRLTHFSHQMGVLIILVAHPFKMKKDEKTGKYEMPDFYSVKGSSAFFEMSYHGLVVYRDGYEADSLAIIKVLKVKQNNLGRAGAEVRFRYERNSGRYIPVDLEGLEERGDQREMDWLSKV